MSKQTPIPDADFKEIVIGTYGPLLESLSKQLNTVMGNQQILSNKIEAVGKRTDAIRRECDTLHGRLFTLDTTGPRALTEQEHQLLSEIHTEVKENHETIQKEHADNQLFWKVTLGLVCMMTLCMIVMAVTR
ncbi:MAG: hypothetical protein IJ151_09265 [Bacteroidales bacterium]|nr:hypothetical protein [Bacteroidales bacterium]